MNLGGLGNMMGAVPGGYQQGMQANNQIEQQQLQLADTRAKQIGMQAYYRALQGMFNPPQQAGGQTPMPGQPSMAPPQAPQMSPQAMPGPQMQSPPPMMAMNGAQPMRGSDGGMMPPDMQSAPAGMPQATGTPPSPAGPPDARQSPPVAASGGQMTWQQIVQAIKAQNPGVDDMALAYAVDAFKPMMTLQAQTDWRNIRSQVLENIAGIRADATVGAAGLRADATTTAAETRAGATTAAATTRAEGQRVAEEGKDRRFDTAETRRQAALDQRGEQFKQREERLERGLQLRSDTTYMRLEQQKQALEARVLAGDKRQAVVELRAVIDAQHKLAMEKIMSGNTNNVLGMKPKDRAEFIKDQNESYRAQIEKLKNLSSQRGNITSEKEIPGTQTTTNLPTTAAPPTAPAAPKAPAINDVLDGHRFKGGDPGNPASWEKVSMSDEQPDPVMAGQQYAASDTRPGSTRPMQLEAGGRGGGGGGYGVRDMREVQGSGNTRYVQREDGRWYEYDNFGPVGRMPEGWSPRGRPQEIGR